MATRFIVRVRGSTGIGQVAAKLHAAPKVQVVRETPRMLLVEAEESNLLDVVRPSRELLILPEEHYALPDVHPPIASDDD